MRADLAAWLTADNTYAAARTVKLTAFATQRTAKKAAIKYITIARDVLKPHLGTEWSQMWVEAGFESNKLSLPKSIAGLLALLLKLKDFFHAHLTYEVDGAGVTGDAAKNVIRTYPPRAPR